MSRITALIVAAASVLGTASIAFADSSTMMMGGGTNNWMAFPTLGGATGGVGLPNTEVGSEGWTIHGAWQDFGFSEHATILGLNYASMRGGKNGWEAGAAFDSISGGGSTEDGWSLHAKYRLAYANPRMHHMGLALGAWYTRFSDSNFSTWNIYVAGSIPLSRMTNRQAPLLTGGIAWDTVDDFGESIDELNYFALLEIPLENSRSSFVVEWKTRVWDHDALFSAGFRHRFSNQFGAQIGITNAEGATQAGSNESRLFAIAHWTLGSH